MSTSIDSEGNANLKNAFPCACQIYTPPQTIAADGGQRGKKRFVALAEMTHTLASRRRLLTIRFIAPAEITHTPWQAVLTYSNWEDVTVCFSESFASLSEGLQRERRLRAGPPAFQGGGGPGAVATSPRWIGSRCGCMKQVACNPKATGGER